jgi:tetratricopeptide (TPR) repeat protein
LLAALGPAAHDTVLREKIGGLLLSYGAPREAADVFRNLIQTDDRDAQAYAGLGEAELALENYRDAHDAFEKALHWNPMDAASKSALDLTAQVLALDPNARGLRSAERYERSKELLQAEVMRIEHCQPNPTIPAQKALTANPRRSEMDDAAEMNLQLAEDLWKQEHKVCTPAQAPNAGDAVARVLARLTR